MYVHTRTEKERERETLTRFLPMVLSFCDARSLARSSATSDGHYPIIDLESTIARGEERPLPSRYTPYTTIAYFIERGMKDDARRERVMWVVTAEKEEEESSGPREIRLSLSRQSGLSKSEMTTRLF